MENLVAKILDLEKEAQKVMEDADLQKQKMIEDIQNEVKRIENDLNTRMEQKIAQVREMEEEVAVKRIADIEASTQESLKRLKSLYEQHGSEWEEMLFQRLFKNLYS